MLTPGGGQSERKEAEKQVHTYIARARTCDPANMTPNPSEGPARATPIGSIAELLSYPGRGLKAQGGFGFS